MKGSYFHQMNQMKGLYFHQNNQMNQMNQMKDFYFHQMNQMNVHPKYLKIEFFFSKNELIWFIWWTIDNR
jgi:hypothetical protein